MLLITLIFFIVIVVIFLFSSKTLSPIPYFPCQRADLPKIIKALNLKNNQTIFDLGAGDGIVIFNAAKSSYRQKLNTKFVAVEINPVLILILHLRRLFHPNKKNIRIVCDDIFKINYKSFMYGSVATDPYNITFYLYISPWYLEKTLINISKQLDHFNIVSYMYAIKSLKEKENKIKGNRYTTYLYSI